MDVFTAMKERRSCRNFLPEPVDRRDIEKILQAATWAPSPLNTQPWEFVVVTGRDLRKKIGAEAESCRQWAVEKSGWKWLGKYRVDFLAKAPVIIAVVGDPKKSGVDTFFEDGPLGYQHACAAAIQNMHLAAHAMGLGSLWFTLFRREALERLLGINSGKHLLGLVCIGKASSEAVATPRKSVAEKTVFKE
jgi:nitroreductase